MVVGRAAVESKSSTSPLLNQIYSSKKYVAAGVRTHNLVYERLKHTHLASAATKLEMMYTEDYVSEINIFVCSLTISL